VPQLAPGALSITVDAFYSRRLRRHLLTDHRGELVLASVTLAELHAYLTDNGVEEVVIEQQGVPLFVARTIPAARKEK